MFRVVVIGNILTPLLFTLASCTAEPTSHGVDITSLNEYVKKMDAVLHEVQSHSQAQEQKYSAVLSSVLSQLTQTTEDLEDLRTGKNVTEDLQQKFENMQKELKNLEETNKKTLLDYAAAMDELAELKQSNNRSLVELEVVKSEVRSLQQDLRNCSGSFSKPDSDVHGLSQLNSTQTQVLVSLAEILGKMNATGNIQVNGNTWPWQYKDIGFAANLASGTSFLKSGRIIFDRVIHNEGNGYDKTTGYFTAPEAGTYLFWTNMVYKSNNTPVMFYIKTSDTIYGIAYGSANEVFGTASETTIFYLKKGERSWISPGVDVEMPPFYPSAGAVLIKQY